MRACTISVIVLSPRVEFSAVAVAVFAVARVKKKNQKINLEILSWRFTTLTKLSIHVSGLRGHKLSRTTFHRLFKLSNKCLGRVLL